MGKRRAPTEAELDQMARYLVKPLSAIADLDQVPNLHRREAHLTRKIGELKVQLAEVRAQINAEYRHRDEMRKRGN